MILRHYIFGSVWTIFGFIVGAGIWFHEGATFLCIPFFVALLVCDVLSREAFE